MRKVEFDCLLIEPGFIDIFSDSEFERVRRLFRERRVISCFDDFNHYKNIGMMTEVVMSVYGECGIAELPLDERRRYTKIFGYEPKTKVRVPAKKNFMARKIGELLKADEMRVHAMNFRYEWYSKI